ncbi:MAG: hypothetical protein IIY70_02475 [Oscillospiraceae bacterium]|nr:hypothetical protein [Oscillospiraceae bacterium]
MLFRKNVERVCSLCAHAGQTCGEQMLCAKRGFVSPDGSCRRFRYDPLKRIPSRFQAKDFSQFSEDDFKL